MNRPHIFTYVIGNPLSCLGILGLSGFLIFRWWTNQETVSGFVPLFAFFMVSTSVNANSRIVSYQAWKREWDAMSGVAEQHATAQRNLSRLMRVVLPPALWVGSVYWFSLPMGSQDDSMRTAAGIVFLVTSLWMIGSVIARIGRWIFRRRKASRVIADSDHVVIACLPVAKQSPQPLHILSALPEYCWPLLQRTSATQK